MGKRSREEDILEIFFDYPTKHLHFNEIRDKVPIADNKISRWLKFFTEKKLIKRVHPKHKMPYYLGNYENPDYQNRKKLFALNKLYESGLLNHLGSLQKAKTIIIFGSLSRSDWYKNSDVDIFIYGDPEGLKIAGYELKLHRDIQLFICQNKGELSKLGGGLIRNIIKGNLIKGNLDFVEVGINA